jgi:hypothetical protein
MKLLLRRTQRAGGMLGSKVLFALDARAELTPEEKSLVQKYTLGKLVVYDSETRKKHAAAAADHFDDAANTGGYTLAVRRQSFRDRRHPDLVESLAHAV